MRLSGIYRVLWGSLRRRLIVSITLLNALVIVAFAAQIYGQHRDLAQKTQRENLIRLAKNIAASAQVWIQVDDHTMLESVLSMWAVYPELDLAQILDQQHIIMASTNPPDHNKQLSSPSFKDEAVIRFTPGHHLEVVMPVKTGSTVIGWVRMLVAQRMITGQLNQMLLAGILWLVISVLLGSLVAWTLGWWFARNLVRVQFIIEKVHQGNTRERVDVQGPLEIARLSQAFNAMLDILEQRDHFIQGQNQTLSAIINSGESWVYSLDHTLCYTSFNQKHQDTMLALYGARIELGGAILDYISDQPARALAKASLERALAGEIVAQEEYIGVGPQRMYINVYFNPIKTGDGKVSGVAVLSLNMTERHQMEDELHQYKDHLEVVVAQRTASLQAAYQDLEAFSYSISHDLRAPLRAIFGYSQVLSEDYASTLDDEGKRLFLAMLRNVNKMDRMLEEMLFFSRMTQQQVNGDRVDLGRMLQAIVADLEEGLQGRNVIFRIAPLPDTLGNDTLINQVFYNLLSNAVKFTRPNPEAEIEVGCQQELGEPIYYVRDNGVGFNMSYVPKLFKLFNRLHNDAAFEGSGIGLAIVRRIIGKHGGRIWVESQEGQGTTFYFTFGTKEGTS